MCLRVSLVPIFYHTLTVYSLSREPVMQGPLVVGDCYLLEESRWPTQPPVCFTSISSTKLIPRRMTTLLKMELLLCRFSELEYRLPPRDFHPSNPSHYLIPHLYFCCMLITAFYTPYTNLTSSSHTTQPVSSGFSEWTSFHITTLYTRFASVLWRTRLPSTR